MSMSRPDCGVLSLFQLERFNEPKINCEYADRPAGVERRLVRETRSQGGRADGIGERSHKWVQGHLDGN